MPTRKEGFWPVKKRREGDNSQSKAYNHAFFPSLHFACFIQDSSFFEERNPLVSID